MNRAVVSRCRNHAVPRCYDIDTIWPSSTARDVVGGMGEGWERGGRGGRGVGGGGGRRGRFLPPVSWWRRASRSLPSRTPPTGCSSRPSCRPVALRWSRPSDRHRTAARCTGRWCPAPSGCSPSEKPARRFADAPRTPNSTPVSDITIRSAHQDLNAVIIIVYTKRH